MMRILPAAAVFVLASSGPLLAQGTAADHAALCKVPPVGTTAFAALCVDPFIPYYTDLSGIGSQQDICIPSTVQLPNVVSAFLTHLAATPADRAKPRAEVIVKALREAYPCTNPS